MSFGTAVRSQNGSINSTNTTIRSRANSGSFRNEPPCAGTVQAYVEEYQRKLSDPIRGHLRERSMNDRNETLQWLPRFGEFLLASLMVYSCIMHFKFAQFVAGIVPAWMPWRLFWAYFTGVALCAA